MCKGRMSHILSFFRIVKIWFPTRCQLLDFLPHFISALLKQISDNSTKCYPDFPWTPLEYFKKAIIMETVLY